MINTEVIDLAVDIWKYLLNNNDSEDLEKFGTSLKRLLSRIKDDNYVCILSHNIYPCDTLRKAARLANVDIKFIHQMKIYMYVYNDIRLCYEYKHAIKFTRFKRNINMWTVTNSEHSIDVRQNQLSRVL